MLNAEAQSWVPGQSLGTVASVDRPPVAPSNVQAQRDHPATRVASRPPSAPDRAGKILVIANSSPGHHLPALEREVAEYRALGDHVAVCTQLSPSGFRDALRLHRPQVLVLSGHGDAQYGGVLCYTFVLQTKDGKTWLAPSAPGQLAKIVRQHNDEQEQEGASGGRRLELALLNACQTYDLGQVLLDRGGIDFVVCWRSLGDDNALRIFGPALVQEWLRMERRHKAEQLEAPAKINANAVEDDGHCLQTRRRAQRAFDHACLTVELNAMTKGKLDSGHAAAIPRYALVDPFDVHGGVDRRTAKLSDGRQAAGVPVLLPERADVSANDPRRLLIVAMPVGGQTPKTEPAPSLLDALAGEAGGSRVTADGDGAAAAKSILHAMLVSPHAGLNFLIRPQLDELLAHVQRRSSRIIAFTFPDHYQKWVVQPHMLMKAVPHELDLLFLNGCASVELGKAILDHGKARFIVLWTTRVHPAAAALFSRDFFGFLAEQARAGKSGQFSDAFYHAKSQLLTKIVDTASLKAVVPVHGSGDDCGFGIADPDDALEVNPRTGRLRNNPHKIASGVPVLLNSTNEVCAVWRELGSHLHTQLKRFSHFQEPVSGQWLSVIEHCVALRVVSGRKLEQLMEVVSDMDRVSDREMQKRRNNIGALYDEGMNKTLDTGADAEEEFFACLDGGCKLVMLLGPAASGKTTIMHKFMHRCVRLAMRDPCKPVPVIVHVFRLVAMLEQLSATTATLPQPMLMLEQFLRDPQGEGLDDSIHSILVKLINGHGSGIHDHGLIILFDGLDEGGRFKQHIEHCIDALAQKAHVHVIVSSRETGFDQAAFSDGISKIFEVLPMTSSMKRDVINKRIEDQMQSRALYQQVEERFREMSRNPLLLSLMIKYFEDNGGILPRSRFDLYENGIDYMLTSYEMVKRGDRGEYAKPIMAAGGARRTAKDVLCRIAASLHFTQRARDIRAIVHATERAPWHDDGAASRSSTLPLPAHPVEWTPKDVQQWLKEDKILHQYAGAFEEEDIDGEQLLEIVRNDVCQLVDLGINKGIHQSRVKSKLKQASAQATENAAHKDSTSFSNDIVGYEELEMFKGNHDVNRVFNEMLHCHCGLIIYIGTERRVDGTNIKVYRFPHLTFQEHFVAQHISSTLQADLVHSDSDDIIFERHVGKGNESKIFDAWFREVMIFLAASLDAITFERFATFLVSNDDGSGATQARVFQMLKERGLGTDAELDEETQGMRDRIMQLCKSAVSVQAMAAAMLHPSAELRDLALTELCEYHVDGDELQAIAEAVAERIQALDGSCTLYERVAGVCSLGVLGQRLDRRLAEALHPLLRLWRSDPSELIRETAGKAIAALLGACGDSSGNNDVRSSCADVWTAAWTAVRDTLCKDMQTPGAWRIQALENAHALPFASQDSLRNEVRRWLPWLVRSCGQEQLAVKCAVKFSLRPIIRDLGLTAVIRDQRAGRIQGNLTNSASEEEGGDELDDNAVRESLYSTDAKKVTEDEHAESVRRAFQELGLLDQESLLRRFVEDYKTSGAQIVLAMGAEDDDNFSRMFNLPLPPVPVRMELLCVRRQGAKPTWLGVAQRIMRVAEQDYLDDTNAVQSACAWLGASSVAVEIGHDAKLPDFVAEAVTDALLGEDPFRAFAFDPLLCHWRAQRADAKEPEKWKIEAHVRERLQEKQQYLEARFLLRDALAGQFKANLPYWRGGVLRSSLQAVGAADSAAPAQLIRKRASLSQSQRNALDEQLWSICDSKTGTSDDADDDAARLKSVRELLGNGASPTGHRDDFGGTALHRAAIAGLAKVTAELTLAEPSAAHVVDEVAGNAPLHYACSHGHLAVVRTLLARGASVNAVNRKRFTPLHLAALDGRVTCARAMLDAGCDPSLRGAGFMTALGLAKRHKRHEWDQVVELLEK